jgi:hypothetical protein
VLHDTVWGIDKHAFCITFFTEIKWHNLSFRKTYFISLRAILGRPVIQIIDVRWDVCVLVMMVMNGFKLKNFGIISCATWIRPPTSSCNFFLCNFPANFWFQLHIYSIISFLSFNFMALLITSEMYKAFGYSCVHCHQSDVHKHLRSLTLHTLTNYDLLSKILTSYAPMLVISWHSGLYLLPLAHQGF